MHVWCRRKIARIAGLAAALLGSGALASGQELAPQPPKQRGAFLVPMLTLGGTYDDNLFFTQFPESDMVTRLSLGVETGYRSKPFTIDVQGSRAADRFREHPDFDTNNARTVGQVALTTLPTRSLTASLFACYLDTKTPSELNTLSGLAVGRSLAKRLSAAPLLEYRLGGFSTLSAAYPVAHDELDGRISDTQTGVLGLDRRINARHTGMLRYEHRWFSFSGGDKSEKSTADVITAGWLGELGPHTLLLLRGGPRFGKGQVTAELLGTFKHRVKRGLVTLTYSKSQSTTLGKTGVLDTQSLVATLSLRLAKTLEVASGPGVYRNVLHGDPLNAMRLNVESLWHFAAWFHLAAAYSFDLQQPDFGADGKIRRGALVVRIIASPRQKPAAEQPVDVPAEGLD
jgi:hypothetical protein